MSPREGQTLRVAVVARSVYPLHRYGGLERHVYDLVRSLLARDVAVTLITPPAAARRPVDLQADAVFRHPRLSLKAVPYTTFPYANRPGTTIIDRSTAYPIFGIRAGRIAARLASEGAVDIVHGLGASVLGYAMQNSESRRAPLVFNPQGLEEFGATDPSRAPLKRFGYWPLRAAVRRCARAADRVIATDRSLLSPVVTHLRVQPEIVRVIPNAIDLDECDRPAAPARALELRDNIGLKGDDLLLLSVGRLEANKGFNVLIRALRELAADGSLPSSWRWVLVGDGPTRSALQRAIASAGLGNHVALRGRAEAGDLHGWYEAATLFVHPTLYEGSSLVTLEAMAHRRAIVATRAGGLPDKVIPGVNGWLVAPGDVQALAGAILDAVSDPGRLETMGRASRELVEKTFSWSTATDRLLDLYAELLEVSRSGRPTPRHALEGALSSHVPNASVRAEMAAFYKTNEEYAHQQASHPPEYFDRLLSVMNVVLTQPRLQIVEIGAGSAGAMQSFLRSRPDAGAIAMELSPMSLRAAKDTKERMVLHAIAGDALQLPFRDRSVNAVVAFEVIEHLPDVAQALDEILRVVRRPGYIIIGLPNHASLWTPLEDALRRRDRRAFGVERGGGTWRWWRRNVGLAWRKRLSPRAEFLYRTPILNGMQGGDADAVYYAAPLDLLRFFGSRGARLVTSSARVRLGHLGRVVPVELQGSTVLAWRVAR